MAGKPPGAGTKVSGGERYQENAGVVAQGSLAAESYNAGGEWTTNRGGKPEDVDVSQIRAHPEQTTSAAGDSSSTQTPSAQGTTHIPQGGEAPTYVSAQFMVDQSGPHGKNIQEGGWDRSKEVDGTQKAFGADVLSKNDPARVAEKNMFVTQSKSGPGQGARQQEIDGEGVYDSLKSDVPA